MEKWVREMVSEERIDDLVVIHKYPVA